MGHSGVGAKKQKSQPTGFWGDLRLQLTDLFPEMRQWRLREFEIFCEVEAILYLYEQLIPSDIQRSPKEAWGFVSGYCISSINTESPKKQMCLLLRERLRYVRTASAWHWWLRWYAGLPPTLRLYQFALGLETFGQQEAALRKERCALYKKLFQQEAIPAPGNERELKPAPAGVYDFEVDNVPYQVVVNEKMAALANETWPYRQLPERTCNLPIRVDLDMLIETGRELDALERQFSIEPLGNWALRLTSLKIALFEGHEETRVQRFFLIDDLFHLVGVLGVGKSTLIWALTYQLAAKEHRHVTVIMSTVVEAIRLAAWLRRLGIVATPALGRNRADHARKYGYANAELLHPGRIFRPDSPDEPVLHWLPTPCALSGSTKSPIPVGQEPCWRLYGEDGKRYRCPLLPVCPVHTVDRDLVESMVWVVNPQSFLYSSAPEGLGEERLRLFEAIYRLSDLVIVDEADRVQVQWDRAFAPTEELVGSDTALLDRLHRQLPTYSTGKGRRNAASAFFNRLTNSDDQTNLLSNRVFRLLSRTPNVAKWIENYQITSASIFERLLHELLKQSPRGLDKAMLRDRLRAAFHEYWSNPLRREKGYLADWISRVLGTDEREKNLRRDLEQWLCGIMEWRFPLRDSKRRLLARKLEFCVLISAMIKRASDIAYQLKWISQVVEELGHQRYELPDEITALVPDPPLGVLLGVRLVGYKPGVSTGVFHYVAYKGLGRWLLLNFSHLYRDQRGRVGSSAGLVLTGKSGHTNRRTTPFGDPFWSTAPNLRMNHTRALFDRCLTVWATQRPIRRPLNGAMGRRGA